MQQEVFMRAPSFTDAFSRSCTEYNSSLWLMSSVGSGEDSSLLLERGARSD